MSSGKINYSRAFLWGCGFGVGLIALEYLNDGGENFRVWMRGAIHESIPYYLARIGIVGAIFMAFAFPINFFRKSDSWADLERAVAKDRSPSSKLSRVLGIVAGLCVFAIAFMTMKYIVGGHYHKSQVLDGAAIISGRDRADFIKSAVSACKKAQLAHPDNKGLSEQIIVRYCECVADGMAATVTNMEMHAFSGAITPELQAKINRAAEPCYPK